MATKKVAAKKTSAKKATVTKVPSGTKAPAQKMTKTPLIRYMAEQMETSPKQIAAFVDLLIETVTTQTRKNGEFKEGWSYSVCRLALTRKRFTKRLIRTARLV